MTYNELIILMTIIFSIITLFICTGVLLKRKYAFFIEEMIIYIFYIIFLVMQYKFKFYVNPLIIFLVIISFIGHSLIGEYLNVYTSSKYFDRFLHAFGSLALSLFFYSILDKLTIHSMNSQFYVSTFVATIGISLGCIFEVFEFILDTTSNSKNQHGLKDTNFDMISDIIGATIAGLISNLILF